MNFLAKALPTHNGIVQLLGSVAPPSGPMIIFEHCNSGTLSAWLRQKTKVTGDVEELMVMFTLQIASAMEFMHDKGVSKFALLSICLHS